MRVRLLMLASATVAVIGCAGSHDQSGGAGERQPALPARFAESDEVVTASASAPQGAAYTIYCRDFTGPNHATVAETTKRQVEQVSGLHDFYLVRGERRTVLYHGFYSTFDPGVDKKEAAKAKADRDLLERLMDARKMKIFPRTVFEPLDKPDPDAPADWDLHNAPGHWTLLVATYTGHIDAKQAAVDSVRDARKKGFEAYYLHKDGQSHVCIGTWPVTAVKRGRSMHEENTEREQQGLVNPFDPPTVVVGMGKLDEKWKNARDDQGRPLELYEMRVELMDAKLKQLYGQLAYAVNGDYLAGEYPLLLEIAPAVDRLNPVESQTVQSAPQVNQDPLLRRF